MAVWTIGDLHVTDVLRAFFKIINQIAFMALHVKQVPVYFHKRRIYRLAYTERVYVAINKMPGMIKRVKWLNRGEDFRVFKDWRGRRHVILIGLERLSFGDAFHVLVTRERDNIRI